MQLFSFENNHMNFIIFIDDDLFVAFWINQVFKQNKIMKIKNSIRNNDFLIRKSLIKI